MSELCLAYPWTPDYVLDALTPRQAPFYLGQAHRARVRNCLDMLAMFHASKPHETMKSLQRELDPPKAHGSAGALEEMARLADDVGDHKAAKRMRRLAFVAPFSRGGQIARG